VDESTGNGVFSDSPRVPVQTQGELQEAVSLAEDRGDEMEALSSELQEALEAGAASGKVC